MKLRDHPLMSYYGHHNWPPVWISLHEREDRISRNEVGVLTEVRKSEIRTDGIVLIMKYNENLYWTILTFPDMSFFNEIFYLRFSMNNGVSVSDYNYICETACCCCICTGF